MLFLVLSQPVPHRPSEVAADRRAFWRWLAPLEADGRVRFCHPRLGRGAVALFDLDTPETLQRLLTDWGEIIPASFEIHPLVDRAFQLHMVGEDDSTVQ